MRRRLAIILAVRALGLTACDTQADTEPVSPQDTVASRRPPKPGPNVAGAHHWIDYFIGMLSPRAMGVCPGLRAQPQLSRLTIRRSFDISPVHEQAARFGYSNDEFVDMVMSAYSKRLDAEC